MPALSRGLLGGLNETLSRRIAMDEQHNLRKAEQARYNEERMYSRGRDATRDEQFETLRMDRSRRFGRTEDRADRGEDRADLFTPFQMGGMALDNRRKQFEYDLSLKLAPFQVGGAREQVTGQRLQNEERQIGLPGLRERNSPERLELERSLIEGSLAGQRLNNEGQNISNQVNRQTAPFEIGSAGLKMRALEMGISEAEYRQTPEYRSLQDEYIKSQIGRNERSGRGTSGGSVKGPSVSQIYSEFESDTKTGRVGLAERAATAFTKEWDVSRGFDKKVHWADADDTGKLKSGGMRDALATQGKRAIDELVRRTGSIEEARLLLPRYFADFYTYSGETLKDKLDDWFPDRNEQFAYEQLYDTFERGASAGASTGGHDLGEVDDAKTRGSERESSWITPVTPRHRNTSGSGEFNPEKDWTDVFPEFAPRDRYGKTRPGR